MDLIKGGVYLDLERPSDNRKLADAEQFLERLSDRLICLDEIQRAPEIFAILRSLIDDHRKPGRFLLLGSASQELLKQASELLAGRVSFLELTPLNLSEVGSDSLHSLWLRGGYPPSFLAQSDERSLEWRFDFVSTFLERDIPQLGFGYPAENMRRFWTMCAHSQGHRCLMLVSWALLWVYRTTQLVLMEN
ncbi:AAA family ATPase [Puniceicoccaceae bacterium K14]|nr:AAA family ATPase [Puniceicoccaceae bacterium K14]